MSIDGRPVDGLIIPEQELEILTSRSGGPGGQHVNKTNSRVTIRWNVQATTILSDEEKARVRDKLQTRLTAQGDILVHHSSSRSQQQNKKLAYEQLVRLVSKALIIPKKRMATRVSQSKKEARLRSKTHRSGIKAMRSKINYGD